MPRASPPTVDEPPAGLLGEFAAFSEGMRIVAVKPLRAARAPARALPMRVALDAVGVSNLSKLPNPHGLPLPHQIDLHRPLAVVPDVLRERRNLETDSVAGRSPPRVEPRHRPPLTEYFRQVVRRRRLVVLDDEGHGSSFPLPDNPPGPGVECPARCPRMIMP